MKCRILAHKPIRFLADSHSFIAFSIQGLATENTESIQHHQKLSEASLGFSTFSGQLPQRNDLSTKPKCKPHPFPTEPRHNDQLPSFSGGHLIHRRRLSLRRLRTQNPRIRLGFLLAKIISCNRLHQDLMKRISKRFRFEVRNSNPEDCPVKPPKHEPRRLSSYFKPGVSLGLG